MTCGMQYPLSPYICLGWISSQLLMFPQPPRWWGGDQKRPWCSASPAQQWLKQPRISNTASSTDPKHSPMLVTVKKISSIPDRISAWILSCSYSAFIISFPVKGALGNSNMQEKIFYYGLQSGYLGTRSCICCSSYTCRAGSKLLKISFSMVKNSVLLSSNRLCMCKLSIHSHISICIWNYLLSFHEISTRIQ